MREAAAKACDAVMETATRSSQQDIALRCGAAVLALPLPGGAQ